MKPLLAVCLFLLLAATVQSQPKPSEPRTKLETFQAKTGSVMIKNFSDIGGVPGALGITVTSYEFVDAQTGKKEYGIGIRVKAETLPIRPTDTAASMRF